MNSLEWDHGIRKCPLDVCYRILPEIVGHLGFFSPTFSEYYILTLLGILFFTYYIVAKYAILGAAGLRETYLQARPDFLKVGFFTNPGVWKVFLSVCWV